MKNAPSSITVTSKLIKTIQIGKTVPQDLSEDSIVFEKVDIYHVVDDPRYSALKGFKCILKSVCGKTAHIRVLNKSISVPLSSVFKVYRERYVADIPNASDNGSDDGYVSEIFRKSPASAISVYTDILDDSYYQAVMEGQDQHKVHPGEKLA